MSSFWKIVNEVILKSDVILIVLDARFVESTRNAKIDSKIARTKKPIIHVITKCDLVNKDLLEKYKQILYPCVFVSSTKFHGVKMLKERIYQEGSKRQLQNNEIIVGVLGYPNTGKSSLINAMTGTNAASTSKLSGWTKAMKMIRASKGLVFLDTPGVMSIHKNNIIKQTITGSIDFSKTKDLDIAVASIIDSNPYLIESFYNVSKHKDPEETVKEIAIKYKMLQKGNKPDVNRAYRLILTDWQEGKITVHD